MRATSTIVLLAFALPGCSGGLKEFPTAKVTGKVVCNGEPVPHAYVSFGPMTAGKSATVGKQAVATADQDGTFVLSTYGDKDGAVVGKHSIRISTPHPEDYPDFTCDCETDGRKILMEVEVKAGENSFVIDLLPKKDKSKPSMSADDVEDIKTGDDAEQEAARKAVPN